MTDEEREKKMKIVYIAGPYSGKNRKDVATNIASASVAAHKLLDRNWGYFCPHLNSAHFDISAPHVSYDFWIEMDKIILKRSADAILMLEGWENSNGARIEHEYAKELAIPIYYDVNDIPKEVKP